MRCWASLLRAVQAQDMRVTHNFSIVDAFAGELPVGLLPLMLLSPLSRTTEV